MAEKSQGKAGETGKDHGHEATLSTSSAGSGVDSPPAPDTATDTKETSQEHNNDGDGHEEEEEGEEGFESSKEDADGLESTMVDDGLQADGNGDAAPTSVNTDATNTVQEELEDSQTPETAKQTSEQEAPIESPSGSNSNEAGTPGHEANNPPLPPRENTAAPPLPPRKREPFFWLKGARSGSISSSGGATANGKRLSSADYDLLLSRLDANNEKLQARASADKDASLFGIKQLQDNFEEYKHEHSNEEIDWEFWTNVINDYSNVARNKPEELTRAIAAGFPEELRGLLWQLIASSKSQALEQVYDSIQNEQSPHEKAIKRDLTRTSFIKETEMDALYRIIKAYSLFDPEIGYTQGMAFVTVPFLINVSEPEAFCLLVHMMKEYGFRELFLPEMPGLHLKLYQFDRILEDTLPDVHVHLARQGVRSSMYASQWFLTLFAYKFPLPMVLRIVDIVITEGIEAILRFAVALVKRNADHIMSLEFDEVLPFLKERIFDSYVVVGGGGNDDDDDDAKASDPQYSVGELITDAFEVKILPLSLKKYGNEYAEIHRIERERVEEVESLRSDKGQLTLQVRRLETSLAALNQEHIQVANEMVQGKLEVARLQDENEVMTSELAELKQAQEGKVNLANEEMQKENEQLKQENEKLTQEKSTLDEQLSALEQELVDTKMKLATLDDSHSQLQTRWNELKKHIEDFSAVS